MKRALLTVLLVAIVIVAVLYWADVARWFLHSTGSDDTTDTEYGFFSGAGSDLTELAIVGGLITIVRKHNCEVHGCWRLGRHLTSAGHAVCRPHHPDDHLTVTDITAAHVDAKRAT